VKKSLDAWQHGKTVITKEENDTYSEKTVVTLLCASEKIYRSAVYAGERTAALLRASERATAVLQVNRRVNKTVTVLYAQPKRATLQHGAE